jgi:15-cis-phytoene desaturase
MPQQEPARTISYILGEPVSHQPTVVIIGGGLSGLSAARSLAGKDCSVILLEKEDRLGGQAAEVPSSDDRLPAITPHLVSLNDAGLLHLLREIQPTLKPQPLKTPFSLIMPGNTSHPLIFSSYLPPPWHLWHALRSAHSLSTADRKIMAKSFLWRALMPARVSPSFKDITLRDWRRQAGISDDGESRFLYPLCILLWRTPPEELSAEIFLNLMRDWGRAKKNLRLVPFPPAGGQGFFSAFCQELVSEGVHIRLSSPVGNLIGDLSRVRYLELEGGEKVNGDIFISALEPHQLLAILPPTIAENGYFRSIAQLEPTSALTVQWRYEERMEFPAGILFCGGEYLAICADLTGLYPDRFAEKGTVLWGLCPLAQSLITLSDEDILTLVEDNLVQFFPQLAKLKPVRRRIRRRPLLGYTASPGAEAHRAQAISPIPNLFLAGGWTATGMEPSLESAVVSGERAARELTMLGM